MNDEPTAVDGPDVAARGVSGAELQSETAGAEPVTRKRSAKPVPLQGDPETSSVQEAPRGTPGKATFVDASGTQVDTRELAEALFAVPANINTLHLVVRAEQAARRRGTASSKTRGEVSGSTAKLYRQKGTGRARVGSVKSPTRVGGGVAFGPRPRSFDIKINRKVVRQALAMALSNRAENGHVFIAADLKLEKPSTKAVHEFFVKLDVAAPVLIVTNGEPMLTRSVRNLPYAETTEVGALSTEQVLRACSLVLTEKAFAALSQA
ncbi:MAG TPA: 50S ribosomal protein L4 [Thermoleophilia bacterium]|nr:50S ribosomal protein L4 [Thermoleophilia bacterium]